MAKNPDRVAGTWHSDELALETWVNKTEAIELMRELSNCGLFKIDLDDEKGCVGSLVRQEDPQPDRT